MADMYLLVENECELAGLRWYELSNWAINGHECKHNIAYWKSANWWGLGPGAHSHINTKRFWNVKHPSAYKQKLFAGESVVHGSEVLTPEQLEDEALLLAIRMREGIDQSSLSQEQLNNLDSYELSGHVSKTGGRICLSVTGRLIADRIVREALSK
jgi:oxygen-independent coproporphyrinogen-3 oxidase